MKLESVVMQRDKLWLVFEWCDYDLKKYMDHVGRPLPTPLVQRFSSELLRAMDYCHSNRILHRDIKPQNVLVTSDGHLKVADLGLARAFSLPVCKYTHEVITLWYRPPEILLGTEKYSTAADIWSVGIVLAELSTPKAVFRGDSEIDQLFKIFRTFGTPLKEEWPGIEKYKNYSRAWPKFPRKDMKQFLPDMDPGGHDLIRQMTHYNPRRRLSAAEGLRHPFVAAHNRPTE